MHLGSRGHLSFHTLTEPQVHGAHTCQLCALPLRRLPCLELTWLVGPMLQLWGVCVALTALSVVQQLGKGVVSAMMSKLSLARPYCSC